MPNYQNGKIYRIEVSDGHFYVGSTCVPLSQRKASHKARRNIETTPFHTFMKDKWEEAKIILIEECPCANKEQLVRRETELIKQVKHDPLCLNTNLPITTLEEAKERNAKRWATYYEAHKDEINEKKRAKANLKPLVPPVV